MSVNATFHVEPALIGRVGPLQAMHDSRGERKSPYFIADADAIAGLWTAVGCECCAPLPANDAAWEPEPEVA